MIVPFYSAERFHAKIEELADLDKPLKAGYLQRQADGSVGVACSVTLFTLNIPADAFDIARFIDTFLTENATQIRACDLPFLARIVSYLKSTNYPIYAERVQALYVKSQSYSAPLQQLPPELMPCVVGDCKSYLYLRQTCRDVYGKMPLYRMIENLVEASQQGSFVRSLNCFDFLYSLVEDDKIEYARHVLEKILSSLAPADQRCFWLYFQTSNFVLLSKLFDKPYANVSNLSLPRHNFQLRSKDGAVWSHFFLKVIQAFPNVRHLDVGGLISGGFLSELVGVVLTREKVETLDIGEFRLAPPYDSLITLAQHESIKGIAIQLESAGKLLDLPLAVQQKLEGVRGLNEDANLHLEKAMKAIVSGCINLHKISIASTALLPLLPPGLKQLDIVLPREIRVEEFIDSLAKNPNLFKSLESISILCKQNVSSHSLDSFRNVLKNFSKLRSFKVKQKSPQLDCLKHNFWFRAASYIPHLRTLACQFVPKNSDIEKLARLSRKLENVHLILEGKYDKPMVLDVNGRSNISCLTLEIREEYGINPFMRMDSIIRACNPEELIVVYKCDSDESDGRKSILAFSQEKEGLVLGVTWGGDFIPLDAYKRLKRIVLVGSFCWNDDIGPAGVYVLTQFDDQFVGLCIDIETKRASLLKQSALS